jgi:wyosine [tRNA(Phe)-imidazoG37] synthetase (radical SAM superfamily)
MVLREIARRRSEQFDHLTFAGSGEPTLSRDLGEIISKARELVDVPIAVITNSTLLSIPNVRKELKDADVVLPSLDAVSQTAFNLVNRPAQGLRADDMIRGLKDFRKEFPGEIWLEVMLVKGLNESEARQIAEAALECEPDRIQLNTVVRPPAEPVLPLDEKEMNEMLRLFKGSELIPDWDWSVPDRIQEKILDLVSNHSYTIEDLCDALNIMESDCIKYCKIMEQNSLISRKMHNGKLQFQKIN